MGRVRGFLALCAALAFAGGSSCAEREGMGEKPSAVGMKRLELFDVARSNWADTGPRPLNVTIWYPADAVRKAPMIAIPPEKPVFLGGHAQRDAAVKPGTYPLVVLSHGTGGAAFQMMWLGRRLAQAGYIAAAVDHHGNSAAEDAFDPRGFMMPWERARDLSAVIDRLVADSEWGPRIDRARIAAGGYSLGGYTVLELAGGVADPAIFAAFCASDERDATCDPQPEFPEAPAKFAAMLAADPGLVAQQGAATRSWRDGRVKAFVALAPALGQMLTAESLFAVTAPLLLVVGSDDRVAPAKSNASHIEGLAPNAHLMTIDKAGHYVFLNDCAAQGRRVLAVCRDPAGVDREAAHTRTADEVVRFLDAALTVSP